MLRAEKVQCIPYEFCDKSVSPWGGLRIVREFVHRLGLEETLKQAALPPPGSNCGYHAADVLMSFLVSIWIGGNRFAHCGLLRCDEVIKKIFGWKRVASESTFSRFFRKFTWQMNDKIFPELQQWTLGLFTTMTVTMDLDSTVVERYGRQEGSRKGYNPRKPGRASHHPLIAFISELKVVANGWLRSGDTASSNNVIRFLDETLSVLGNLTVGLLRADSGFFSEKCLHFFESRHLSYIVAARFTPPLKRLLVKRLTFVPVDKGIEVTEFFYKAHGWNAARRFVVVRKNVAIYPQASGKELELFPCEDTRTTYRYSMMVTNLALPPNEIWQLYRRRSDSENRIKELKEDFAINGFSSHKFYATEAAFRFALVAYNTMALFRLIALKDKRARRMATLYLNCIAIGSWTVSKHGREVLKLSVPDKRRQWIQGLFTNIDNFSPPLTVSIA